MKVKVNAVVKASLIIERDIEIEVDSSVCGGEVVSLIREVACRKMTVSRPWEVIDKVGVSVYPIYGECINCNFPLQKDGSCPSCKGKSHASNDSKVQCVRVEYDPEFWGGDYSKLIGQFIYLPVEQIDRCPRDGSPDPVLGHAKNPFDMQLKILFRIMTGIDAQHIIHYSSDETYDQEGNPWKW